MKEMILVIKGQLLSHPSRKRGSTDSSTDLRMANKN
jgi:hypothetical protein